MSGVSQIAIVGINVPESRDGNQFTRQRQPRQLLLASLALLRRLLVAFAFGGLQHQDGILPTVGC